MFQRYRVPIPMTAPTTKVRGAFRLAAAPARMYNLTFLRKHDGLAASLRDNVIPLTPKNDIYIINLGNFFRWNARETFCDFIGPSLGNIAISRLRRKIRHEVARLIE